MAVLFFTAEVDNNQDMSDDLVQAIELLAPDIDTSSGCDFEHYLDAPFICEDDTVGLQPKYRATFWYGSDSWEDEYNSFDEFYLYSNIECLENYIALYPLYLAGAISGLRISNGEQYAPSPSIEYAKKKLEQLYKEAEELNPKPKEMKEVAALYKEWVLRHKKFKGETPIFKHGKTDMYADDILREIENGTELGNEFIENVISLAISMLKRDIEKLDNTNNEK